MYVYERKIARETERQKQMNQIAPTHAQMQTFFVKAYSERNPTGCSQSSISQCYIYNWYNRYSRPAGSQRCKGCCAAIASHPARLS